MSASKRRRRRLRGKRKELEAKKQASQKVVWDKLTYVPKPTPLISSVVIPIIRAVIPAMIAQQILSVQPMMSPIGEQFDIKKKKIQKQRKAKRKFKKITGLSLEKIILSTGEKHQIN